MQDPVLLTRAATRNACSCTANGSSENVLAPVVDRQYVFTLPKLLRPIFSRQRTWLGELCRIAARLLTCAYAAALPISPFESAFSNAFSWWLGV